MKKIKSLRLASILLIGTLLTTCLLGGTFAKYTTGASGSSAATVARWSFLVNGDDIAVAEDPVATFNLFDTVCDVATSSVADKDILVTKIAPGSGGKYSIKVTNTSDISAKYSIKLEESNPSGLPIQYSLDGENWVDSIDEISTSGLTDQTISLKDTEKLKEHIVYWRWVFDGSEQGAHAGQTDITDSGFGAEAETGTAASVMVTATITASQVD